MSALCKGSFLFFLIFFPFLFILEREHARANKGEGQREREREPQAGSALSTEPTAGLNPTTLGPLPEQNQELDSQLAEPPRCPQSKFS